MKCDKYKFIFIDITKTAGSSIIKSFKNEFPNVKFEGKHHSIPNYTSDINWPQKPTCSHITEEDIKNNTLFTVVRNPWARLLSQYLWGLNRQYHFCKNFKYFVNLVSRNTFKEYNQHRYKEQIEWISDNNGKVIVDRILFFESLESDFKNLLKSLNIPNFELLKINVSRHKCGVKKHYTEYYDEETKSIVAEKYARDIEYFGYKFGG